MRKASVSAAVASFIRACVCLAVAAAACVLVACAGIPKPEAESDTLVVGSLVIDYPDGFYNLPARRIESGIRLDFVNSTSGRDFAVYTSNGGYFYFLSNGTDRYMLKDCRYEVTDPSTQSTYSGGARLAYKFSVEPKSVQYLGHLIYHFSHPKPSQYGNNGTAWSFDRSVDVESRLDALRDYLQTAGKDSVWTTYEILADFTPTHVDAN